MEFDSDRREYEYEGTVDMEQEEERLRTLVMVLLDRLHVRLCVLDRVQMHAELIHEVL